MASFIKKAPDLSVQTNLLNEEALPAVEAEEDIEFGEGTYILENYRQRDKDESYFSDPIIVEGRAFKLELCPDGDEAGKGTHISCFMYMCAS